MQLYYDNNSTLEIAHNLVHDRTKHIKIDKHFIIDNP